MINRQRIFQIILFFTFVLVSYLVFSKPNYPQNVVPHFDKIGHIGSFFVLAWLTYLAFLPRWLWLFLILAGYGLLIEIVQSQLPYRSGDSFDFIADMAGVVLFYLCFWCYRFSRNKFKKSTA